MMCPSGHRGAAWREVDSHLPAGRMPCFPLRNKSDYDFARFLNAAKSSVQETCTAAPDDHCSRDHGGEVQ